MNKDIQEILISTADINKRVEEMGTEITKAYPPGADIVLVCILRGAIIFMADLARQIKHNVAFDFMDVCSYGSGTESSGVVRILKDLEEDITDRHVLIVEDIIDTGTTLKHVIDILATRQPAGIKIVTLLDKPERRIEKRIKVDYNGFSIPDRFVVGYGLDYDQRYRNLPYIAVLKPDVYT